METNCSLNLFEVTKQNNRKMNKKKSVKLNSVTYFLGKLIVEVCPTA